MTAPLFSLIRDEIVESGPISVARYMALCLGHPAHGYYRTRDPLGRQGDFVTAPEISQMFGELIGIWVAAVRASMGAPAGLALVELGPGRGTLMADALRALRRAAPDFRATPHLVETSPILRAAQAERLGPAGAIWHESIDTLPAGPAILVANEFFDALPVRQLQRARDGWRERRVGLAEDGARLAFGLDAEPNRTMSAPAPIGAIVALPGPALDIVRALSRRLAREGGALLAIDYGHERPGFGDTLQAVSGHAFVDPLAAPGEADLTTHVDFAAMARAATAEGARAHGPADQRDFLLSLGLRERAERLTDGASPAQAEALSSGLSRLIGPGRRGMGSLFKALAIADPRLPPPPGLA